MADERTIALYNAKVDDYAAFTASDHADKHLTDFMAELAEGGKVLDLGCGPAIASKHLKDAGFTPDPVDASAGMVKLANEKFGVGARIATFDEITGEDIYDGVWANFSLLHAERSKLPQHLKSIALALRPDGVFHIGMKTGSGAGRDNIDRFYTYLGVDELQRLIAAAGLTVTFTEKGEGPGLAGNVEPWVICRAVKNA